MAPLSPRGFENTDVDIDVRSKRASSRELSGMRGSEERREEKRGGGVGGQGLRLGEPWGAAFCRVAGVEVVEWSSSSD